MSLPPPLQKNDVIGVMSPSSYIEKAHVEAATKIVESHGYRVKIHPQTLAKYNQSAGTNEEKLQAFYDMLADPDVKAIVFAGGGNRALHWIDQIDWNVVKTHPKIMMGFSDCTSLLNIIFEKTGLVTYHGPTLKWFLKDVRQDQQQCFDLLSREKTAFILASPSREIPAFAGMTDADAKTITGQLVGGNASIMQYLTNDLTFKDKIVFLEDRYIETSRLDLLVCHLRRQGVFDQAKAVLLGTFNDLLDTERPYGFTLEDIIAEHIPQHVPVIRNCHFGHVDRLVTLPIGQEVTISRNDAGDILCSV